MARTILITGCSSGIGECAALGMRNRGWQVFATARKPEDIAALDAAGVTALYLDYTETDSIAAAVESVFSATSGGLDALFNNGAYGQPGALEDVPTSVLREQFDANFFGWHDLTRRVIPAMRRQGHGRIVMNSSVLGIISMALRGPYSCTKFALETYCDTLRIELAGSGVFVTSIEPGSIRSRFGITAAAMARKNIDVENSVHKVAYRRRLRSMQKTGVTWGELGPEAVLEALVKACESAKPRPQYFVTQPTRWMSLMKRLAPKRQQHAFLTWASSKT